MNKNRSIKILIILLFLSNIYATKFENSENLINNGGFELKKHRWILKGNTEIVSDFSNKGFSSLKLTQDIQSLSYVFQHLDFPLQNFTFSTWIFPETKTYKTQISFVSEWDKTGFTKVIELTLSDDSIEVFGADTVFRIENKVIAEQWNKISIATDSSGLIKNIYINENNICTYSSGYVTKIEAIILGDLNCYDCNGTVFYDDVKVLNETTYEPPEDHNLIVGSFGLGYTFAGPTFGLGFTYETRNQILMFRYLKGDEIQFSIFGPDRLAPNKQLREIALLYGLNFPQRKGIVYLAGGIGYIDVVKRGDLISGNQYEAVEMSSFGFALDAGTRMQLGQYWGIGVSIFSNINSKNSIIGFLVNLQLGKF